METTVLANTRLAGRSDTSVLIVDGGRAVHAAGALAQSRLPLLALPH